MVAEEERKKGGNDCHSCKNDNKKTHCHHNIKKSNNQTDMNDRSHSICVCVSQMQTDDKIGPKTTML